MTVHTDLQLIQGCLVLYGTVSAAHAAAMTLETAECVIRARLAIYAGLTTAGWTPPDHVVREEITDRHLLRQEGGAVAG